MKKNKNKFKKYTFIALISLFSLFLTNNSFASNTCNKSQLNKIKNNLICKKNGNSYKWIVVQSKNTNATPIVLKEYSDNEQILITGLKNIRSYESNQKSNNLIEYYLDSELSLESIDFIKNQNNNFLNNYGDKLLNSKKIFVIVTDKKMFVENSILNINNETGFNLNNYISTYLLNSNFDENKLIKNFGLATNFGINKEYAVILVLNKNLKQIAKSQEEIFAHELFHIVQFNVAGMQMYSTPCWFLEGSASAFGTAMANQNESFELTKQRIMSFGYGQKNSSNLSNLETCNGDNGQYQQGRVAELYLISKFGVQKQFEFLEKIKNGQSWQNAFADTFPISLIDFYYQVKIFIDWFYGN